MPDMIPDPETYFRGFIPLRDELLIEIEQEAEQEHIPIVGPVVGEFLYILAKAIDCRAVLELGTATGYSAIYLARGISNAGGILTTIERDEAMAARARENIAKAGLADQVEVRVGEVAEVLETLKGPYDLIFMDIEKKDYQETLSRCHSRLRLGGLLVVDNVAFLGAHEFNQTIFSDNHWRCVHLYSFLPNHSPEKDGLTLAVRVE
ncbi:MAG: O-methyltransferase [Syntrophobacterales bacterium]|jgi:predicted O-methyltransferase YrrM